MPQGPRGGLRRRGTRVTAGEILNGTRHRIDIDPHALHAQLVRILPGSTVIGEYQHEKALKYYGKSDKFHKFRMDRDIPETME